MKNGRIPTRILFALIISTMAMPCPYILYKGNPFHDFSFYDRYWGIALLFYILGNPLAILLTGTAHMKINNDPERYRGKRMVYVAYIFTFASYVIPHILMIFHRIFSIRVA